MPLNAPSGDVAQVQRRGIDWTAWGVAMLSVVPMLIVYVLHYVRVPPNTVPTGFVQPDMASYMAEARAFFSDGFHLTYGLPFSQTDATPRIYFQPLMFMMGLMHYATGFDPGTVFVATGIVSAILMFRIAFAMQVAFYGRPRTVPEWLTVPVLLWGGGIAVFCSLGLLALGKVPQPVWFARALFNADAGDGGWFPYLGRNVYFANEAFYHVVFLLAVVLFVQRRFALTLVALAVMAASHPITGIELLLVIGTFSVTEFAFFRRTAPPAWFIVAGTALVALHLFYYMVGLSLLSAEHRQVQAQFDVAHVLTLTNIIAAYLPAMVLAALFLIRRHRWHMRLTDSHVRLLLVWFAVAMVLSNHELFTAPRQPVHFTRGYIWIPLALLALPVVEAGFRRALSVRGLLPRAVAVSALLGLIVLDDVVWFGRQYYLMAIRGDNIQQYLRHDTVAVIGRLSAPDMKGRLLLSNDQKLAYYTVVYLPMRTWFSHGDLTPHVRQSIADLEHFFAGGTEVPSWRSRPLVVAADLSADPGVLDRLKADGFTEIGTYGRYALLTRPAAGS